MPQERVRKVVITGVLGAIAVFLGLTRLGFIPWFTGVSLTIMHVPAVIGAVLEGPGVGVGIGLIFGAFSMIQAAIPPTGQTDVWFTNPLISVIPRLFIGPVAWAVWRALQRWPWLALITAGAAGSLTNTFLVLGAIGLLGLLPWAAMLPIVAFNGIPEAIASALLTLAIVAAYRRLPIRAQGARL
ncbi:hypothetical protein SE15_03650 [Thermanaerothrix daxensis]|uniref:ECF transporter S component n=1 Tax=Thermanaerothrix daxensis TaxID=869279 RepID=A0A0P6YH07_9CHLR|nr:ECF transporter S component [Thermanaerothrix daxensis]KPL84253.1 hypothetical protein SE15_03650 [Thermanaerothrix daxensis]